MSLTAEIQDLSTPGPSGPITAWDIDFGDGSTHGTGPGPWTRTYAAPGSYTVTLEITGTSPDGTATVTHTVTVAATDTPPVASFKYVATGLAVNFTDTSKVGTSGTITGWAWDFGDGNTSTSQNPPHTYASGATRTVTLTVTGGGSDGTNTTTQSVTVASSVNTTGTTPAIGVLNYNHLSVLGANANKYHTLVGTKSDLTTLVAAKGKALIYMAAEDVSATTTINYGVTYDEANANNWLLKDAAGNYLHNQSFPDYIGDIGAVGYQNQWITNVLAYLGAHPGLDGVFVDDCLYDPKALCGAYPSKYPTTASWAAAMTAFCAAIYTGLHAHGYYVCLNAGAYISGNTSYVDGTLTLNWFDTLGPHADALMNEFYCEGNASNAPRKMGTEWWNHWDGWQRLIPKAQSKGCDFVGLMKGASSTALMMYGKASFLMEWDGGGGVFMYTLSGSTADPTNAAWTTDIGTPTASKSALGVGWKRPYTGGIVIINPSTTTSQAFALGATYNDPSSTPVSSVTLAAGTAMILTS